MARANRNSVVKIGQVRVFHMSDPDNTMGWAKHTYARLTGLKFIVEKLVDPSSDGLFIICFVDGVREHANPRFIEYHSDLL